MMRLPVLGMFLLAVSIGACSRPAEPDPPRQYPLTGQIMAINVEAGTMTVKHDDIEGLMPAMTMTFPVASDADLRDRIPGDLISATLEVAEAQGRLLDIVHTGSAPLPTSTNEAALAAGILDVGDAVPDAALIDQHDRRRALSDWQGVVTLVGFVYTTCPLPNFCPLVDRNFAALQQDIVTDPALVGQVQLISVSIDPVHDTPDVLAAHASRLGADPAVWTFLTGDPPTVDRVAGRYGVGIVRPEAEGDIEIRHNLRTTLVGRDGRVRAIYTGNEWTPDDVRRDLRAAAAAH